MPPFDPKIYDSSMYMHLLRFIRESYFDQYRAHYLGYPNEYVAFEEMNLRPPDCEKEKKLFRHHHRQILVDRITYHMLRDARHSHEDTVELMKASASSSRPPSAADVIRHARDLASAILRTIGEPDDIQHGYHEFSDRTIAYFKAFLAAHGDITFRSLDHYVNYFKAMMAAGIITIRY